MLACCQEEPDDTLKIAYLTKSAQTDWAEKDKDPVLEADLLAAIEWASDKRAENIISQREKTMRAIKKFAFELSRDGDREKWLNHLAPAARGQRRLCVPGVLKCLMLRSGTSAKE